MLQDEIWEIHTVPVAARKERFPLGFHLFSHAFSDIVHIAGTLWRSADCESNKWRATNACVLLLQDVQELCLCRVKESRQGKAMEQ